MTLLADAGSAFGGPLVAAPVSVSSPFDGLWLVQDGQALASGIANGDWVEGGMGAFSLLLDGVAALIDPIGTLIGMGLSWVLEHIWPLNEYLNALTGNAGEVLRMSQTWANISTHLAGAGADLTRFLGDLDQLEGVAVEAYRKFQADVAEHIQLAGTLSAATSAALEIASTIVKIVHDLTRDVISQIAGTAISAAITTAATVGFGAPVAIAQVAARVSALVPKVVRAIEALLRSFERLAPLLNKVDEIMAMLRRVLDRILHGGGATTGSGTSPGVVSGGYRGPRRGEDPYDWAEDAYEEIRASTTDVDDIVSHPSNLALPDGSTLTPQDVADIKSHLFVEEHLVTYGDGSTAVARFDAEPRQVEAWFRLENGTATSTDRLFLLHEITELRYLRDNPGASQTEAHGVATAVADWQREVGLN